MSHHISNCTVTRKKRVLLVIKDYKLIKEFLDSDFFLTIKSSKIKTRICLIENSYTLKQPLRHNQLPSSSGEVANILGRAKIST